MHRSASQIRSEFIEFFVTKAGHTFVPSSPVVPHDDPTLLFTNAGMNQFKDVFLGSGTRHYNRAVNTQKCIRAGGKHNDLEDVGKDTYHHTFFEMLGNWSFGEYFKKEAIQWAWQLLTEVWKIDKRRLHATVFEGDQSDNLDADDEAAELWRTVTDIDPAHIHKGSKKDNFWEMGETGPCGPCSEIHYDSTRDFSGSKFVNTGDPRVLEIWNLVFIQFNRSDAGTLTPLPAKHVDTGMGLERIISILQKTRSNYDTDLWTDLFISIETNSGAHAYSGSLTDPVDIAYRVIADHIRCLTVALTDGARPGNEGRGYVLRRILRRAVRHAHQTLGVRGPLLYRLVPAVVESLGDAFPELTEKTDPITNIIRDEEESFLRTLDRGIELFTEAAERAKANNSTSIAADDAFKLHDTFGFPIDLTRVMAEERGMTVDEQGFNALMEKAREVSRKPVAAEPQEADVTRLNAGALSQLKTLRVEPTREIGKYHGRPIRAVVKAIWNGTDFDDHISDSQSGKRFAVIVDRTNFYSEAGGQIGDRGWITDLEDQPTQFIVEDTQSVGEFVLHLGRLTRGHLRVGEAVRMAIQSERRASIRANHTGTHLLNWALREVLGDGIEQKGSLVADDRLRFDFSYTQAMTQPQILEVEKLVNTAIHNHLRVYEDFVSLDIARKINGVRAVFGERYPDLVRVVSIGVPAKEILANPRHGGWQKFSIEFCGGTHLAETKEAKHFIITSEQALAAGVRRVIALTGDVALAADLAGKDLLTRARNAAKVTDKQLPGEFDALTTLLEEQTLGTATRHHIQAEIEKLRDRVKSIQKAAQSEVRATVVDQARAIVESVATDDGRIIVEQLLGADTDSLLAAMDVVRSRRPESAAMLLSANEPESKVFIVAAVPQPLIETGLKAGDWVKQVAMICGGGGGGRPDLAQAGGKDPSQIPKAIIEAKTYAQHIIK